MGNLIIPAKAIPPSETRKEVFKISVDDINIPPALEQDFAINSHLEPVFHQTVAKVLNLTLSDPRTALRNVTQQAIKERIQLCADTVVVLRYDMKYSLRKALDLLPEMILRALVEDKRPEDLFEKDAQGNAWGRGNPRRVTMDRDEMVAETLNEEAEELDDE